MNIDDTDSGKADAAYWGSACQGVVTSELILSHPNGRGSPKRKPPDFGANDLLEGAEDLDLSS